MNVVLVFCPVDGPSMIVLPVPVYVPLPMNLYTQYTPKIVGLPLPVCISTSFCPHYYSLVVLILIFEYSND